MEQIVLTGHSMTAEQFYNVVYKRAGVSISPEARNRLERSRKLLNDLADSGQVIYGLNVGVGWNKDKAISASHYAEFNRKLIYSHCVGLPPWASEIDVRAALLARLNTFLVGAAGVSPEIPMFYAALLNHQIHPLIPQQGSVGQADIGLMSFVGLTILGEGQVYYKGKLTDAKLALEQEGIAPLLQLGPKDGLSIVSTNGFSLGQGMLVLKEFQDLLRAADLIYCCTLEALNGSISPFSADALKLKTDEGSLETGAAMRRHLSGSFLHEPDANRPLQDPLCYRNVVHIHGAAREMLEYTKERMLRAINASEDNPGLDLEEGSVIVTSNYEPLNWVLGMESLALAVSHIAHAAGQRMIRLANPVLTGLPRFLAPSGTLGFATFQKTYTAQFAKIRHLSNPVSSDTLSMAGAIEDRGTNAPYVVGRLRKMLDILREMLAIELMHAAQGQDFRLKEGKQLGKETKTAHTNTRKILGFLDKDRVLTHDILALRDLIAADGLL